MTYSAIIKDKWKYQEYNVEFMSLWKEYKLVNLWVSKSECCIKNLEIHEERKVCNFWWNYIQIWSYKGKYLEQRDQTWTLFSVISLEKRLAMPLRLHWMERKDVDSIFLATNGKNRYIFVLFRNWMPSMPWMQGNIVRRELTCVCKKTGHIISACRVKPPMIKLKPNFKAYQAITEEPKSKETRWSQSIKEQMQQQIKLQT